jgi:hypothetical protein
MSRPTRSSRILAKTIQRVAGMRTIADPLDFGDDLSLAAYNAKNQALQTYPEPCPCPGGGIPRSPWASISPD